MHLERSHDRAAAADNGDAALTALLTGLVPDHELRRRSSSDGVGRLTRVLPERDAGQIYSQRLPLPPPSAVAVAVRLLGRDSDER